MVKKLVISIVLIAGISIITKYVVGRSTGYESNSRMIETITALYHGASLEEVSSGRIQIWKSAIRMIKDNPIMGIGAGMWEEYAFLYNSKKYLYYYPRSGYYIHYSIDSHNIYLDMYLRYGVVSLVVFIYIVCRILKISINAARRGKHEQMGYIYVGISISFMVWLFIGLIGWRAYFYQEGVLMPGFIFWCIVAAIWKYKELADNKTRTVIMKNSNAN